MRTIVRLLTAMLAIAASSGAAVAETDPDFSTQGLYLRCKSNSYINEVLCDEYIEGIFDEMGFIASGNALSNYTDDQRAVLKQYGMCYPYGPDSPGPTKDALGGIFLNWAAKNPKQWDKRRGVSVIFALREAFPCR
jgi:hypothetical protein